MRRIIIAFGECAEKSRACCFPPHFSAERSRGLVWCKDIRAENCLLYQTLKSFFPPPLQMANISVSKQHQATFSHKIPAWTVK